MRILFDTSAWINHFHRSDAALSEALENDLVVQHPLLLGELVMGRVPAPVLGDLEKLPLLPEAHWRQVLEFVQERSLAGKGLSWVDAHLLYSTLANEVQLVTHDRALRRAYARL
jgi:hypothetical protein